MNVEYERIVLQSNRCIISDIRLIMKVIIPLQGLKSTESLIATNRFVCSDLKHRRWINSLDCDEATTSVSSLVIVSFTPTELGNQHIFEIIEKIVGYISDLRNVRRTERTKC